MYLIKNADDKKNMMVTNEMYIRYTFKYTEKKTFSNVETLRVENISVQFLFHQMAYTIKRPVLPTVLSNTIISTEFNNDQS